MSLPINLKFEVPKLKAPAPTKTPLWPSLTPPPQMRIAKSGEKLDATAAPRPITNAGATAAAPKAREGRPAAVVFTSPRRSRSHGKRSLLVKVALPGILLFSLLTFVNLGCATEKPKAQGSVLDVGPEAAAPAVPEKPAAYNNAAAYTGPTYNAPTYSRPAPSTAQPVTVARPTTPARPAPAAAAPAQAVTAAPPAPARPAPKTYVVQKGDTLFGIARSQYGDGNQWRKIAAANPSMDPDALKLGQRLVIPQ